MPRNDLIVSLAQAGATGDRTAFKRTLEAMVADERGRQHHVLADRLAESLAQEPATQPGLTRTMAEGNGGAVLEVRPHRLLANLVLPVQTRVACDELIEEQPRAELLRANALEPRHRILLSGAPGNGKTSLAEAIAGELGISLYAVRYESVIGSFLGETAVRLARLFELVRTRRCVLFFDEFDAIGKERGDEHETGEIKRVVSSLLLNVDALPSYVVVVAATNHPELLDRAVWRRFQVRLDLPLPGPDEIDAWFKRFEQNSNLKLGLPRSGIERLKGLSYAELEEFCLDIQRRVILAGHDGEVKGITAARLAQWSARSAVRR